ncbi:MAG: OmpA family protein [Alphaproteobacteria bacterium]|nr:OmpA family protein [Alphaproteobacteria bacterium]
MTTALIALLPLLACHKQAATTTPADLVQAEPAPVDYVPDIVVDVVDNFQRVRFETDSAALTAETRAELDHAAEIMQLNPFVRVAAIGHADERGSAVHNMELGAERAQAVEDYLVAKGIDERRIYVASAGEHHPLIDAPTQAAWAYNRRVEFRVAWDPYDEVDGSVDNSIVGSPDEVSSID